MDPVWFVKAAWLQGALSALVCGMLVRNSACSYDQDALPRGCLSVDRLRSLVRSLDQQSWDRYFVLTCGIAWLRHVSSHCLIAFSALGLGCAMQCLSFPPQVVPFLVPYGTCLSISPAHHHGGTQEDHNLCTCSDGYSLQDDKVTCKLGENICKLNNGDCQHICNQIIGNYYKCSCLDGFALDYNQKTCSFAVQLSPIENTDICDKVSCQILYIYHTFIGI